MTVLSAGVAPFTSRPVELLGFVAAICTTAAFVPQLARVIRLRSARDISLPTFLLFSVGVLPLDDLRPLHWLQAGHRLERDHSGGIGKHSRPQAALRPQRRPRVGAMSHEGIRIVNAEQAQREQGSEDTRLPTDAVTPLKVRVKKTEGTGVEIDWRDGHKSSWNFRWLRDACPCATCHDEREKSGRAPRPIRTQAAGSADDVRSATPPGRSHSGGQVRAQIQMERRPRSRHLLLGLPAPSLPMRNLPRAG